MSLFMLLVATTLAIFILMAVIGSIITSFRMWARKAQISSVAVFTSAVAGIILVYLMFANPITWSVIGITALYSIALDICRGILFKVSEYESAYKGAPISQAAKQAWEKGKTALSNRKFSFNQEIQIPDTQKSSQISEDIMKSGVYS